MRYYLAFYCLLASMLLLAACQQPSAPRAQLDAARTPISSPSDERGYAYLQLPNQLRVLLVSDPKADKAAAALDVHVGSSHDPENRAGLAHFLEHMLFLGTAKYPQAGEYQEFIQRHGGSHNAYTAYDHTNYFFDVEASYLEPALDRFAQFFIAPLFNAEYVEREKHAVDSEYQSRRQQDAMLQYDVLKALAHPAHPFSKFTVGSLESLATTAEQDVRDELLRFYERYYSANLMTLVVIGKESLPELEAMARAKFGAIKNRNTRLPAIEVPLYPQDALPARVNILPEKDIRRLTLQFPIPDIKPHYRGKPTAYIANLLGHEGPGSLLSLLKQRGWADSLSAGAGSLGDRDASFDISIGLTAAGLENIEAIVAHCFDAVALIERQGIEAWRYEEQSRLQQIEFRFQQRGNNINYASRLANNLHDYALVDLLQAPYLMEDYDPALIRDYLSYLKPDNLLLLVTAKGLDTDRTTAYFDAQYSYQPLPAAQLHQLRAQSGRSELALPVENPFIPENLSLLDAANSDQLPERIYSLPGLTVWHEADTSFGMPRADFYFSLRSPAANASPRHQLLTDLWVRAVNETLNEYSYPAYLAGLDYNLYRHVRGIGVRISGYTDKQRLLLDEILNTLKQPQPNPEQFAGFKDELQRRLVNQQKNAPYNQAVGKVSTALIQPSWTEAELLAALTPLQIEDLAEFGPRLFEQVELVALANGNLAASQAREMARIVEASLLADAQPVEVPRPQVVGLRAGSAMLYPFEVEHPDSAILSYYQGDDEQLSTRAQFMLLQQMLSAPFFQALRTESQLGYVVFASSLPLLDRPGLAFVVQSPNTSGAELNGHVQQFITGFAANLAQMPAAEFERHKAALLAQLLERDTRLSQRSARYWAEIDRENFAFDTRARLAEAVATLEHAELIAAYQDYLLAAPKRLLTVIASGQRFASQPLVLANYLELEHIKQLQQSSTF